jgi:MSHA pilin protein MshA
MRNRSSLPRAQAGFTLIELIIVIVVIGILAAVAIPKLSGMTDEANKAKNTAVLGALKSAWTIAFAKSSGVNPTAAQIVAEMADPACTAASNVITCGAEGTYTTTFTYTPDTAVPKPAIACTTTAQCK